MKWVNVPGLIAWFVTLSAAVIVWVTGVFHLFFLTIPVWLATAILYIILSYVFGAGSPQDAFRRKLGELPDEAGADGAVVANTESDSQPAKKSGLCHTSGLIALASLVVCFGMAIWVAVSADDVYIARVALFKTALIYITVIYFIFGTIWLWLKEKSVKAQA